MGSTQSVSRKVNFEDIQYLLNKTNEYILINTLDKKDQDCLIKNTILIQDEEKTINHFMKNKIDIHIIIYDKNANVPNLMKKYEQLIGLGFTNVYIYPGGLFEWLCLQDIYGIDDFPTTKKERDILKYKGKSAFTSYLLKNDID
jgi:hypothetical protein|tara:strand:- start:610 stop:1041 length:432 start_codon:yes stop_codon:yes gene_type:complete